MSRILDGLTLVPYEWYSAHPDTDRVHRAAAAMYDMAERQGSGLSKWLWFKQEMVRIHEYPCCYCDGGQSCLVADLIGMTQRRIAAIVE